MRGPKRPKVNLKKRKQVKYHSDSGSEEDEEEDKFHKTSTKELQDLDILGDKGINDYSGSEDDEEDAGLNQDEEEEGVLSEKKAKKEGLSLEQVEESRTVKMASIISKLLETKADEKRPVLSLKKKIEKELDNAKLEAKAVKVLSLDKKQKAEVGRIVPTHATTDYEKSLRKMATRGVVQLFNALRAAQKSAHELEAEGIQKNVANVPTISKQTFLSALKNGESKAPVSSAEKAVPFLQDEFAMQAPKHWDEENDEDEN